MPFAANWVAMAWLVTALVVSLAVCPAEAVLAFAKFVPLVCCEIAALAWTSPIGKTESAPKATVLAKRIDSPFLFVCILYPPIPSNFKTIQTLAWYS